jgi:hypothetical protein
MKHRAARRPTTNREETMSTPQTTAPVAPRFAIRPATLATAIGVLVAITVSIVILVLTGSSHNNTTIPLTPSQAGSGSVPQIHYLGPRQDGAGVKPLTPRVHSDAQASAAGASNPAPRYTCVPEKFCVRVR